MGLNAKLLGAVALRTAILLGLFGAYSVLTAHWVAPADIGGGLIWAVGFGFVPALGALYDGHRLRRFAEVLRIWAPVSVLLALMGTIRAATGEGLDLALLASVLPVALVLYTGLLLVPALIGGAIGIRLHPGRSLP